LARRVLTLRGDQLRTEVTAAKSHNECLQVLGQSIRIRHRSEIIHRLVASAFGSMGVTLGDDSPDLEYEVEGNGPVFLVNRTGQTPRTATGLDSLLHVIEKDMTVEVQKKRSDLFFLHAAAIEWKGRAYVLAADTGSGKSTTTWALLHHGFGYLSDELSPIDLGTMKVLPYPHALCVKAVPPPPYPLPAQAIHLGRTIHIPTTALPARVISEPCPLAGVFLLRYSPAASAPSVTPLSAAEGAARIYVTALNALAHEDAGLAPALQIASCVPCFALTTAGLVETCILLRDAIEQSLP
jgi:hypothetical protein